METTERAVTAILGAQPVNVALLCVIAALGVVGVVIWKRRTNGSEKSAPLWRVEQLEKDVEELASDVRLMLPQVIEVKAEVRGLARLMEILLETHRTTADSVKALVDRLK